MPHERDTDKRMVGLSVERSLHRAIVKKWGRQNDVGYGAAYRRALEEATAGYQLTADDYLEIAEEVRQAMSERQAKRNSKK